ncbi:MAG TPA: PepSY-associated TM helix domain-containing protein [Usitatibacter sp.]|nr:PepSY-associated TM helix domain-containing protein [Usitatibacter sp.]
MSARDLWVQVHLWLGLTLGVLGVVVGVTGSVLLFDRQIDGLLAPDRYRTSGAEVARPYSDYVARAGRALEGLARPFAVRAPEAAGEPVIVLARAMGEGGGASRVFLDPPTGRVLAIARGGGFVGWVHNLHENLAMRELHGREIVGAVGIAMLASSLTGAWLWWPGRGRLADSLGLRKGLPLSRNLHYLFGFYGVLVLGMLSFTGIFIAYTDAGRSVVSAFGALTPPARNVSVEGIVARGGAPVSLDGAIAIARAAYPGENLWSVTLPGGPRGTYRINLGEPGVEAPQSARGIVLFIDPATGFIVRRADPANRTKGDAFLAMQRAMHSGAPFGPIGRIVMCIAGLLPGLFVVTGSMMWLRNRRSRLVLSARAA